MYVKSKLDNKNLFDEFLREAGLESERRGRPFNMQLADEVLNQWANNEQRKAQIATMKKLMEFVREFSVTLTPNYRSEVAAIVNRRNIQLARIERLIQILQDQGKDAPNLEKVRNAHKTIFTGTNTFG